MNNLVGATIEHYRILVKVRETPTRVLYKAFNTKSQNYTAVEFVKISRGDSSELLQVINEQVHKNAALTHPNIAAVTDTGIYDGSIYIVYNFLPTHPLRRFFNRIYSWQETSRDLLMVAHAIAYAHEREIFHGDLHPSSILLDEKRNPILFDFGFERIITDYVLARSPGAWINRWGYEYRPPEYLNGAPSDARCDIYAMGMMLHEWLIGNIALLDSTIIGTLRMRATTPDMVKSKHPIAPAVQSLIKKCTAPSPEDRYPSMQEVYIVLARGALDMTITQKMVRKPLDIPAQRFNSRQLLGWIRNSAIMAIGAIVIFSIFNLLRTNFIALPPTANPISINTQARPTSTQVRAASSPTQETSLTQTTTTSPLIFPVFQATSIASAVSQTIEAGNISNLVMLSQWGIGDINRTASSPDGNRMAVASSIGIFIFDANSLQLEKFIDTRSWVTSIDYSSDGQLLVSGDRDGLIQLWDTQTWEESEAPYSGHTKSILDLAFSPDGKKLASISLDNRLIQWKVNSTDTVKATQAELIGGATAVAYSADNTRIITGGNDFQINIWDTETLNILQTTAFSSRIVDIASINNSNRFVIGGNDQKVALLDITGQGNITQVGALQYSLTSIAVSSDATLIAAGDINGGITVWENSADSGRFNEVWKNRNYVIGDPSTLNKAGTSHSILFAPDGASIYSGLHNGFLRNLDARTGAELQQNLLLNAHAKKLAISPDGKYLLSQQEASLLTVWDIANGIPLYQLRGELKDGYPFSQDGQMFAVDSKGSSPAVVKVYNPANGIEIYTLTNYEGLETLQFINDDELLVTVYDKFAHVWSMSSGQELKTSRRYEGSGCSTLHDLNEDPVVSITTYHHVVTNNLNRPGLCAFETLDWKVDISEENELIAFGGNSKLSIVSNIQGGNNTVQDMRDVNQKNIVSVAISPNGGLVAAAFDDHTLHVWDIATREILINIYGHNNSITDLRFTPDSKFLISTSMDGTIRIWGIPYGP
ncbi:MAG: protein kinase [Chloroflexi bacterium]|nr:protein kinase [Chloroflexota bacterium]